MLDRCIADADYRGNNAPPEHKFKVYTSGQKRRVTPQIKREFKLVQRDSVHDDCRAAHLRETDCVAGAAGFEPAHFDLQVAV